MLTHQWEDTNATEPIKTVISIEEKVINIFIYSYKGLFLSKKILQMHTYV